MSTAAARLIPVPESPRVILPYERVSKVMGREDEVFRSPDLQRASNLRTILEAGGVPYQDAVDNPERYRDIDSTGRDFNREGIQRALDLKRRGVIDGISVIDVSRVGRTTSETLEVIEQFREGDRGIFLSSKEKFDDTPTGEWLLKIMVSLAELYSDNIALGWRQVIEDRAQRGLHNGTPPIGYDFARDQDGNTIRPARIVLDPKTAPYIREAFHRFDAGESSTSIAKWLTRIGILNQSGLSRQFSNPFYLGDVRLKVYRGKAKKRVQVKDAPPVVVQGKGQHPPLLVDAHGNPDRALFDRVQARLADNSRKPRRHINPVHALGGLAFCHCGRALVLNTHTLGYRYLVCMRSKNEPHRPCPGVGAMNVEKAEAFVLGEVRRLWEGYALGVGEHAAAIEARRTARAERERIEQQIERCLSAITDMDADFYDGRLPEDRHERLTARKNAELATLRNQLLDYELGDDEPDVPRFMEAASALLDRWETSEPAQRNAMLKAAGVKRLIVTRKGERPREPLEGRAEVIFSV